MYIYVYDGSHQKLMQGLLESIWHYACMSLFCITLEQNVRVHVSLTTACCVHSNVYGLINTCCIRYLTVIDSIHSTSPPVHIYHTLTSESVELPHLTHVDNPSSIRVVPVTQDTPTWNLGSSTASCVVSHTEQGSIKTFTNVLQVYEIVVLVCCTSKWEPGTLTYNSGKEGTLHVCTSSNYIYPMLVSNIAQIRHFFYYFSM